MKRAYRTNAWGITITPIVVHNETEHFITFGFADRPTEKPRREKKNKSWANVYSTWTEAREAVIAREKRALDVARAKLTKAEEELALAFAIPEQEPQVHPTSDHW